MESNSARSSVFKWEKPIEVTKQIDFSMPPPGTNGQRGNNLEHGSSSNYPISASQESAKVATDGLNGKTGHSLPPYDDDPMMIGLRLGRQKEYGDNSPNISSVSSVPTSSTPTKRSRASYQNMQNPCCQVEGCNLDLKSAKDYHRRHRICESHSKSPKVIVAGMERRFCQQCSRFHDLSEFDDKKRSCRRRLSDHNARRRRVQPESVQLNSVGLSSALYDQRQQNLPLNGLPISLSNSTWENANTSMSRQAFIRPSRSGGLDGTPCFPSDEINKSLFELHMDLDKLSPMPTSNPGVLDQCLQMPTTNSPIASDILNAHSLLSSNSWSLNEGESTSMEILVHGNYINPVIRKSNSEPQNLSLFQSFNIPLEQGTAVTMVHSVSEGTSKQQGYQLFEAPYDYTGFCSGERNL